MNYLLDTHAFLWWHSEPEKLSSHVRALFENPAHTLFLSLVSVWEMQIKSNLGKLHFQKPLREVIEQEIRVNQIQLFPISFEHIMAIARLPHHHKDPFDRLLIAQGVVENIPIVSDDPQFARYAAQLVW